MEKFSDRISFARKRMRLSQAQLAASLGVSRGACGQWEQGVSRPSSNNMEELARITEVSFEWLATGRGPPFLDGQKRDLAITKEEDEPDVAGRPIRGDLRDLIIWMQKLPKQEYAQIIKLLRALRKLME